MCLNIRKVVYLLECGNIFYFSISPLLASAIEGLLQTRAALVIGLYGIKEGYDYIVISIKCKHQSTTIRRFIEEI